MDRQKFKENGNNKYPVSTDTLDFMQNQILLASELSALAGGYVIIKNSTSSRDGICIYNGELMPLKGSPDTNIIPVTQTESITANGEIFRNVRTIKYAQYAPSGGALASSFWNVTNLQTLKSQLDDAKRHHMPKGSIIDWYGNPLAENVPYGFVPCGMFGKGLGETTLSGQKSEWEAKYPGSISIRLVYSRGWHLIISQCLGQDVPDLSDKFVVQAGWNYDCGDTGGKDKHVLTLDEIPSHKHDFISYNDDYNGSGGGETGDSGNDKPWLYGLSHDSCSSSNYTDHKMIHSNLIEPAGGGIAHENRPPYFALYKLIKVI